MGITTIDLATGNTLDEESSADTAFAQSGSEGEVVLSIAAPDGRTIFSIQRLLNQGADRVKQRAEQRSHRRTET